MDRRNAFYNERTQSPEGMEVAKLETLASSFSQV